MSIPLLIANILTVIAFFLHAFVGDKELKLIEPDDSRDKKYLKREKWTMARSGWHWISVDLVLALKILSVYFLVYGLAWLMGIAISKKFPLNYIKLGQWLLLWSISALVYWASV